MTGQSLKCPVQGDIPKLEVKTKDTLTFAVIIFMILSFMLITFSIMIQLISQTFSEIS